MGGTPGLPGNATATTAGSTTPSPAPSLSDTCFWEAESDDRGEARCANLPHPQCGRPSPTNTTATSNTNTTITCSTFTTYTIDTINTIATTTYTAPSSAA